MKWYLAHGFFSEDPQSGDAFTINKIAREIEGVHDELLNSVDTADVVVEEKETHAFEIDPIGGKC